MITRIRNNIDGILLLDKPKGLSSNIALQKVKRLFNAKKAGHTGSLDPLATGMLPICFGQATKFSRYLLDADKHYEVTAKLGVTTTTGDTEGEIIDSKAVGNVSVAQINLVLQQFSGNITQIPPMYSALKYQGQPLYHLARQGKIVPREPRQVNIFSIQFNGYQKDALNLSVHCSKGTYIRTLIEDIGKALGCGAHVTQLHRSCVAKFEQYTMHNLERLTTMVDALETVLLPLDVAVGNLPKVNLVQTSAYYLRQGQPIVVPNLPEGEIFALFGPENVFLGVGKLVGNSKVAPVRLVNH